MNWLSLVLLGFSLSAFAGVDQGNPKARSVYNLKHDYRIILKQPFYVDMSDPQAVRIDVVHTYRKQGHFVVAKPQHLGRKRSCQSATLPRLDVQLHWIGKDCHHEYFKRAFEILKVSIQQVQFPNKKGKKK